MSKITLDLEVAEALLALGPIQDKALEASRLAAISTGDEHEIADLTFQILNRVATQITDALYPAEPDPRTVILREQIELRMVG